MGLKLSRAKGESYYLIINKPLEIGSYIKIEKDIVCYWEHSLNKECSKDFIEAPNEILILREEILEDMGGLENIVKQIKEGTFKFKK